MAKVSEDRKQQLLEISAGILIALLFFLFSFSVPYQRLELLSLDARFNLRPPIEENPDIATIDIDNRALKEEGRWQDWTRDKHARVIDVIRRGGGALIGVDIYFSEPSERAVGLQNIQQAASLDEVFSALRDYDAELAEAAEKAKNIYWGATFVLADDDKTESRPKVTDAIRPRFPEGVLDALVEKGACISTEAGNAGALPRALSPQAFPIPSLLSASRGVGFAQIERDADGLVRKYPTLVSYQIPDENSRSYLFPSVGLAMACDYLQVPLQRLRVRPGEYVELPDAYLPDGSRKTLRIPVNDRGEMVINWAGDYKESFRHYPYSALIRLGEQDVLNRIKEFLSLQDPTIFRQPGEIMAAVASAFPEVEDVSTYVASLYGAFWYEKAVTAGEKQLTPSLFEELFGLSPDSAPNLFQGQREVFENVRAHHVMLDLLSRFPDTTVETAAERGGLKSEIAAEAYGRVRRLVRAGGPQAADRPLFFLPPVEVGEKEISLDELRGGVFFYGLTADGTHDLNPMPFDPRYPMVGSIANVFNTIVTAQFITPMPVAWRLPLFLFLGLFTGYILSSRTTIRGSLFTILFLIAYLLFAYWIFVSWRIWIDVVPVAIILISDVSIVWYKFNAAEKKRRFIKSAFSHYLSPTIVDQIAKNPEMLGLGGREMELTAFFSDVADFTSISEQLSAPELVEVLNEYFTAMTDIVTDHGGYLDKYVGDAIVAVFGAPLHYPDHAAKAVFVALEMQKKLPSMREKWKSEGRPELRARIGISSGSIVVGNMGSKARLNYTIMGDPVNLASRLEGVNKQYGTNVMISEFTHALCKSDIRAREIDLIRVKGKAKPVSIYEVLARANEALPDDLEQAVRHFVSGLESYRSKDWRAAREAFERALAVRADDGPSLTYLKRCKEFMVSPPPDDWDGVYVMTSK